ncbi:MAG: peptidylprolyl isomerase [Sneathiella sp.]|nr:peptidylprolyl isomerase [Sneathiella sp.]
MVSRKFLESILIVLFLGIGIGRATAQDVQKIVAVVNEEVISGYDLVQRISLTILMSGFPDNAQTRRRLVNPSLTRLIDDRLKLQEAARFNLTVTDLEMNKAVDLLEKQNKVPAGKLDSILARRNIGMESLLEQIRARIAWDKVVRRRIAPRVNVTEEEIASLQSKMEANKGKNEYLLSEIFIPVTTPSDESKVRKLLSDLLVQIKSGAKFHRVAAQFSQGTTAAKGGAIGWTMAEDLEPELASAVMKAKRGAISQPIRTADGYYIIAIRNIRKILDTEETNARLDLSQLVIPIGIAKQNGTEKSQIQLINSLSKFIDNCNYVPALLSEIATKESGKMGKVELKNLPEKFKNLVKDLKPGQASVPYLDKDKYRIFIVCSRQDQSFQGNSVEAVRQRIGIRRIEARAQRYLKDLQRDSTIETR